MGINKVVLHVEGQGFNGGGASWVMPLGPDEPLCLEDLIDRWLATEYCGGGEVERDGPIDDICNFGCFLARIVVNGDTRKSCGFWVKAAYD